MSTVMTGIPGGLKVAQRDERQGVCLEAGVPSVPSRWILAEDSSIEKPVHPGSVQNETTPPNRKLEGRLWLRRTLGTLCQDEEPAL